MLIMILVVMAFLFINILAYELLPDCRQYYYTQPNDLNTISSEINQNKCLCGNQTKQKESSWNEQTGVGVICVVVYWPMESQLAQTYQYISSINFWIHAIIFRTLPCILMLVLSCLLINIMHKANLKKQALIQQGKKSEVDKASEFNRTTTMLLIIVILFFIMEFPHGILYLISGFWQQFFYEVYAYYADLLDVIVLLNSSINFFLYCFMSAEFRKKFTETFCLAKKQQPTGEPNNFNRSMRNRTNGANHNIQININAKQQSKSLSDYYLYYCCCCLKKNSNKKDMSRPNQSIRLLGFDKNVCNDFDIKLQEL